MTNNETVEIELQFEDGSDSEIIELDIETFSKIQYLAQVDNVSFEDKFLELLKQEIEE